MPPTTVLEHLRLARRIADHADRLGIRSFPAISAAPFGHLGAVLADSVLQAGLNYRTVVRRRVERIQSQFPEAAVLSGIMAVVEREGAGYLLLWNHPTKVERFLSLASLLSGHGIETTDELAHWLRLRDSRDCLLELNGIGPKTCDYLCCLVGIDCVAIDRHVRAFAFEAGVRAGDYDSLKLAVSYAADLLGIDRRDFDSWIWRTISDRAGMQDDRPRGGQAFQSRHP
jgi:hypothetical protein